MNKKLIISAAILAAAASSNAFANVTYNYVGKPLDGFDPVHISLTFLDDGSHLQEWSVSQSLIGTLSSGSYYKLEYQIFETDSVGHVTGWYMDVTDTRIIPARASMISISGLDALGRPSTHTVDVVWDSSYRRFGNSDNPGQWTSINGVIENLHYRTQASPIPEPSTYAMLLAGLGLVGFMVRRRNRQQ